MDNNKKRKLKVRMNALREKYYRQLPQKFNEIEQSWQEYQTDLSNPGFIETFYRFIHTLRGTAATFGFNKQADICFTIQELLIAVKENKSMLSKNSVRLIQELLGELKVSINTPAENIPE